MYCAGKCAARSAQKQSFPAGEREISPGERDMDFCRTTEELWKGYFSTDIGKVRGTLEILDEQAVIIGTGAHEFYVGKESFRQALEKEMEARRSIAFQIGDFWCEEKKCGEDACLVYGGAYIWWKSEDEKVSIDMDSRFTFLYRRTETGWKVVHIHQSLPNREQMDGEFYPKTLTEQVLEVQAMADRLSQMAHRDSITGLMNYSALEEAWQFRKDDQSWLIIADIDNFKEINDTYGHIAGNHMLRRMAERLSAAVRGDDIVCRMGGDEFILVCGGVPGEAMARKLAERILKSAEGEKERLPEWPGLSMGMTAVRPGEALETTVSRADRALYRVKNTGKNGYELE